MNREINASTKAEVKIKIKNKMNIYKFPFTIDNKIK